VTSYSKASFSITLAQACVLVLATHALDASAGTWSRRMGDSQGTANAGADPRLTREAARDLKVVKHFPMAPVATTPLISGDLLITIDSAGVIRVTDIGTEAHLVAFRALTAAYTPPPLPPESMPATVKSNYAHGIQLSYLGAGTVIGTVTVPDASAVGGTREEERLYVTAKTLIFCLSLDRIRADRASLNEDPGTAYVCEGAAWPRPARASPTGSGGSSLFSRDLRMVIGGREEIHDVVFDASPPETGQRAVDAYTGKTLWTWSPMWTPVIKNGTVIWTSSSMSRDGTKLYITTNELGSLAGGIPELQGSQGRGDSTVALDPATGKEVWFRQHRVHDEYDMDVGNGATVADVEGPDGCHLVVVPDKDGCIYAYRQDVEIPQVSDPDYDPLRVGQQRVVWKQCFTVGLITGGFNAMAATFDGRRVFVQANSAGGQIGTNDTNGYALNACTGKLEWASSTIGNGYSDGAAASGMWFIPSLFSKQLQVVTAEGHPAASVPNGGVPTVLATVQLPGEFIGGCGPAIADGRIFVPTQTGVSMITVVPGSNSSPPVMHGNDVFQGPYPFEVSEGGMQRLPTEQLPAEAREPLWEVLPDEVPQVGP
jgi:outer membrane protein assembly factor BamB